MSGGHLNSDERLAWMQGWVKFDEDGTSAWMHEEQFQKADVAQLVEQRIRNAKVVRSIRIIGTKLTAKL